MGPNGGSGRTRHGTREGESGKGCRARRGLPESCERMRRFRYRPAAGRVSRARSLALFSLLPLFVSLACARGRTFRLSHRFSLSFSLSLFFLPSIDPHVASLSLAPSIPTSLSFVLFISFSQSALAGAIVRALLPFRLTLSHLLTHTHPHTHIHTLSVSLSSLIRSRRFRLPSSSRRSESNRL